MITASVLQNEKSRKKEMHPITINYKRVLPDKLLQLWAKQQLNRMIYILEQRTRIKIKIEIHKAVCNSNEK